MKFNEKHYNMVKAAIGKYDNDKIINHKKYLIQQIQSKAITVSNFEARFVADIYYGCVPLETRLTIIDEGDYKDAHIQTAVRNVLKELNIL